MRRKPTFAFEAMVTLAVAERVLNHFGHRLQRADKTDFSGFAGALASLCCQQQRDSGGIDDLETTIAVLSVYRDSARRRIPLGDEQLRRGFESAERCRTWLRQTFPEASPRPEVN